MPGDKVAIVGGGLAGLCCAVELQQAGVACQIFEAADAVGGRVRTDHVDGFLLDRGFQVLLTSYPEAERLLDYTALQLERFEPGALIRHQGCFHRFADPWRRPQHALQTALSPIATLGDKLRVAQLRRRVCRGKITDLYDLPEETTIDALRRQGFSDRIIARFFKPFLGGVFLDATLQTSSRMFDFVFRMFSLGDAALPTGGMGAITQQLADQLPAGMIHLNAPVSEVKPTSVRLSRGEQFEARAVVLASEAPAAAQLLDQPAPPPGQAVTCLYFAAEKSPMEEGILVLNGDGVGPINNLCVPSQVSRSYAPENRTLVSVTVLGATQDDEDTARATVVKQLRDWFGAVVDSWQHLRTYQIPYALPNQQPPALSPVEKSSRHESGVFVCGDYLDTASIQGAMASGRRAAQEILAAR